jgi:hypothetical protein
MPVNHSSRFPTCVCERTNDGFSYEVFVPDAQRGDGVPCDCFCHDIPGSHVPCFCESAARVLGRGCLCAAILGSQGPSYRESGVGSLPRNSICVGGERIEVNFLSLLPFQGHRQNGVVVPRAVQMLLPFWWRIKVGNDNRIPWVRRFLFAVAFESGSSLRVLLDEAVARCKGLRSICIPSSVEFIGEECFGDCTDLAVMTFEPDSRIRWLGNNVFQDCRNLQFADIPQQLELLPKCAFWICDLRVIPLGSLCQLSKIGSDCYGFNRHLRSVVIPGSVIEICDSAFFDCRLLEEVQFQLPSKLAQIGRGAFQGCESLTQIYIVGSVCNIAGSFIQGSGVHDVIVDSENEKFQAINGSMLVRYGTYIVCYFGVERDVRIPSKIATIGESSFTNCGSLRSVTFEPGSQLTWVESFAFCGISSLQRVQFRSPRPILQRYSFARCTQLKEMIGIRFAEDVLSESILKRLIEGEGYRPASSE